MTSFGRPNKPTAINLPPPLKFMSKRDLPPPNLSFTTSAPLDIAPNDSSSGSSEDEDEPQFVGTPYKTDPSGPYEYPFPPMSPTTARSLLSSSAPFTASATLSNVSLPSTSSFSSGPLASLAFTPAGYSPGLGSSSRIPPPPRLHSRVPSTLAMSLKLDSHGPIPPGLIGRDLGKLSPALGLEPGEILTPEKMHMAGRSRGKSISTEGALALNLGIPSTGGGLTRGPSLKRGGR